MGIVVTVFMLLGLLTISPLSFVSLGRYQNNTPFICFISLGLLLAGLWNSLWHGLRYLDTFWGLAALVSGFFMVCVAVLIIVELNVAALSSQSIVQIIYRRIKSIKWVLILGLLASFCLYAITLIQLNLGYPIIH